MFDKANDDGSLACLNIPRDESSRSFNCEATSQSKLVNTAFWVMDIIENVETRFSKQKNGEGKHLVKKVVRMDYCNDLFHKVA